MDKYLEMVLRKDGLDGQGRSLAGQVHALLHEADHRLSL